MKVKNKCLSLRYRYARFRANVFRTKRIFELSLEEFKEITSKECYFCSGWLNEDLKYCSPLCLNESEGFKKENCVPACGVCKTKYLGQKSIKATKVCERCGKKKERQEFLTRSGAQLRPTCKDCKDISVDKLNQQKENKRLRKEQTKQRAEKEILRLQEKQKIVDKYGKNIFNRLKRHNITLERFEEMLSKQNHKCLVCGKEKKLYIDHCHKENKVRGLLCNECNVGIGMVYDSVNTLKGLIQYAKNKVLKL